MKRGILAFFIISVLSGSVLHAQKLETAMDSLSYSVGILLAQNLKAQGLDKVDIADLQQGLADVFSGTDLKIDPQTANVLFRDHMMKQQQKALTENKMKGQKFLQDNAKRAGVQQTASGLQYEVLTPAEGPKPKATDDVTVHYEGKLIDGTIFDSSIARGEPTSFPLNRVIPGWTEGLQLMSVGAKYRFYIPSELAYGERGAGQDIGPNETLIFEVELIKIGK